VGIDEGHPAAEAGAGAEDEGRVEVRVVLEARAERAALDVRVDAAAEGDVARERAGGDADAVLVEALDRAVGVAGEDARRTDGWREASGEGLPLERAEPERERGRARKEDGDQPARRHVWTSVR
jgi:hypothetical protein